MDTRHRAKGVMSILELTTNSCGQNITLLGSIVNLYSNRFYNNIRIIL